MSGSEAMIDKIDTNQIQDPFDGQPAGKASRSKAASSEQADATLQINYDRLIEAAKATPADAGAVQRARELLESGQLDNPANIREAASNIITFGI